MMEVLQGHVREICIARVQRGPMESVREVMAIEAIGLDGDRYASGHGSYQDGIIGKRQVTLMHKRAFDRVPEYAFLQSRRNILVDGEVELAWILGKGCEFNIGTARFKPVGYCDPCHVPTKLAGKPRNESFRELFWESGGIIAAVVIGGMIQVGSSVIAPSKGYGNKWGD